MFYSDFQNAFRCLGNPITTGEIAIDNNLYQL